MTNAELISKIRKEIISRIDRRHLSVQANNELVSLLSFLDTLESETKEEKKVPTRIYLGSRYEFIRKDILLNEIERLKNNNEVSDDKEYASYELDVACGYDMACDDLLSFLSTLESEKPMNLEEEINRYLREECSDDDEPSVSDIARHFAQWGAEWQKEQMMKEAVKADVMLTLHDKTGDISLHTGYLPKELGIKCDDKVRIIIIKE